MKKLGICVCYRHKNYGSQLQSYATTVELKRRNIDFEIIRFKKKITPGLLLKLVSKIFNPVFLNDRIIEGLQKKIMLKMHPDFAKNNAIRDRAFDKFADERFTDLSPVYYGFDELQKGAKKYRGVLVGSDQLWSPGGFTSDFYNLMFAPDDCIKISYATSFGVSSVKKRYYKLYSFLDRMSFIGVRENSGKKLVEQMSNNSAQVVVDPVLLLDEKQWLDEIPNERMYDEPYIFAYFLGKSEEYRKAVTEFAKAKGLKIVTEPHMDSYNKADVGFGDCTPFNVGPAEFVNLIRNAEYVFTDSFHGSVFSVIHKKQFTVFNRYADNSTSSKNSRIDSFCENYGLSDRRYSGNIFDADKPIDYEKVLFAVEKHRKQSLEFLDRAFATF